MDHFLISLLVICLMIPLVIESFKILTRVDIVDQIAQDEVVTYQLRKILLLSDNISCYENEISFDYHDKTWSIYHINNHVILTPGVQIQYTEVEDAYFSIEDSILFIYLLRNGNYKRIPLVNAK